MFRNFCFNNLSILDSLFSILFDQFYTDKFSGDEVVLSFEHDDYADDDKIEGADYSTLDEYIKVDELSASDFDEEGNGPNYDGVEDLTIDMKNEKDPSKWEISGTLRRGGPY